MTLVDSNVLLDLVAGRQDWTDWSKQQLEIAALNGPIIINDVIYAEISARFAAVEVLDFHLQHNGIDVAPMPRAALFLAGKVFLNYRAAGGLKTGVLPDFFIGGHAVTSGLSLLTRDVRRYRTYFPTIELIAPRRSHGAGID